MNFFKTYNPLKLLKYFNPLMFAIWSITIGVVVSAGVVFYGIYWFFNPFNSSIYKVSEFNKEVWFDQERIYHPEPGVYSSLDCTRGRMYEDLDKNYLKNYMRKEEVEAILGHSTVMREYPDSWIFKYIFKCFQYNLGTCRNGPRTILRFCALKGTNSYSHKLSDENDGGVRIFEDEEIKHQKYLEWNKRIEKEDRERKQLKLKENSHDQ